MVTVAIICLFKCLQKLYYVDDEFNHPEVKCCTDILNEWVYGDKDIINTTERIPWLAHRFVKDVYLCIYIDEEGTMYQ